MEKGTKFFEEVNTEYQIKRNERIKKEIEERQLKPSIDDEILETFISLGQDIKKGFSLLFDKKE